MIIKYEKIMQDILKDFNKGRRCKTKWLFDLSDDTYIYIAIDGHYILSVPRCLWMLDTEKIINQGATLDHNHCFNSVNVLQMIKSTNMLNTENFTFSKYNLLEDKRKAAVFKSENVEQVWIDEKFFKYLDVDLYVLDDNVIFSGTTKTAPLIIHEGNYFIGFLLPINHN